MQNKAPFRFKKFQVYHERSAHKVGTDAVLLGCWVQGTGRRILDVGSGCGLIALIVAQRFGEAQIEAIEKDGPSAEEAQLNVVQSPFAERVQVIQGDFLQYHPAHKFDLIVSNPPFYQAGFVSGDQRRDEARQEKFLPQADFLQHAAELLNPNGRLALVLPKEEAQNCMAKAEMSDLYLHRLCKVRGRSDLDDKRWLLEFSNAQPQGPIQEEELCVRAQNSSYSEAYKSLTSEFYLNF